MHMFNLFLFYSRCHSNDAMGRNRWDSANLNIYVPEPELRKGEIPTDL